MDTASTLDSQVNGLAVMILVAGGPTALAPFQETSRFERMAQELEYSIRNTSRADMTTLMGHLANDGSLALVRRITGLWDLASKVLGGTGDELAAMLKAYSADELIVHLGKRVDRASAITTGALSNGAKSLSSLARELMTSPAEAGPKLLVLVLSSVAVSGGVDGNGGVPDMDIPLMGIGAHRSPFTHSIIVGAALETALFLLARIVLGAHKNLPTVHDPLWEGIVRQSVGILKSAGKGASIGLAYHLMVDAVVQPGAYHGMPFDMPIEAHQTIMGANSVAEATAARSFPDEATIANATPEALVAHKKYRANRMHLPAALEEKLSTAEVAILVKYGAWLQALARRTISPTTPAQVQFLNVVDGRCAPSSDHEKAWMALVAAKSLSGWTTKI
jgi:hypothetical protein